MTPLAHSARDMVRLLDSIDWTRCSGRDLHRLAEGAAQATLRGRDGVVGLEGLTLPSEFNTL